ncbi:hypothetical protein NIB75_26650 [Bacteroides uniformis]|nr:hypothetical protein [Bacteroides uniformis]MCO7114023.1 hypothetical protein [Bacteroides uniformis]MCO7114720.1 hypothetical protein [Bacteroides uniformis]
MMENIFILPGNEQELFNRYLDNNEYGPLKERLELVGESLEQQAFPG